MLNKLLIITLFSAFMSVTYILCMQSMPGKGVMRIAERLCLGIILCYLCQLVAKPFGIVVPQSPLAALAAGCWGIPGVSLAAFLAQWP